MAKSARGAAKAEGVHAIKGEDSFLAERALEALLSDWVGPERDDSVQILRGEESTWSQVFDAARSRSLFAPRRAVVVRRAEALRGGTEGLEGYLDDPTPDVALILLISKVDGRRAHWKLLFSRAHVSAAEPLKGRALRAYVEDELRRRSLRISGEGVQELVDQVGQELRRLMGEIDKLEAYGMGGKALAAEEVSAVVGRGFAQPLFRLSDAFASRDCQKTLELAEGLLEEGEEALLILGALHRSLRQVRGALALRKAKASREEMLARLLPPNLAFKLSGLLDASKAWSEGDLRTAFVALGQADRRLKSSVNPRVALSTAVVAALGGVGPRTTAAPARALTLRVRRLLVREAALS